MCKGRDYMGCLLRAKDTCGQGHAMSMWGRDRYELSAQGRKQKKQGISLVHRAGVC